MEIWNEYFLGICNKVAENSKCMSRKIGAIIVKDKSIISTGYNGPPRGVPHCNRRHLYDPKLVEKLKYYFGCSNKYEDLTKCPRQLMGYKSGEGLEWCVAGHAERNAIVNAAREGIKVKGTTMFMNCNIPCTPCLVEIINSGISEIVVIDIEYYDISAKYLLCNSKLIARTFDGIYAFDRKK